MGARVGSSRLRRIEQQSPAPAQLSASWVGSSANGLPTGPLVRPLGYLADDERDDLTVRGSSQAKIDSPGK
jgi:hypothetical protein